MKIKFENYIRLHSILIRIDTVKIWELLKHGQKDSILNLPDETWDWCNKTVDELEKAYKEKEEELKKKFEKIHFEGITRSEFAKEALLNKDCRHVLFTFFDNHEGRKKEYIWDMVKPKRIEFNYKK
jgi:RNA ligase